MPPTMRVLVAYITDAKSSASVPTSLPRNLTPPWRFMCLGIARRLASCCASSMLDGVQTLVGLLPRKMTHENQRREFIFLARFWCNARALESILDERQGRGRPATNPFGLQPACRLFLLTPEESRLQNKLDDRIGIQPERDRPRNGKPQNHANAKWERHRPKRRRFRAGFAHVHQHD
jgi:hypothetical protein